MSQVTPGWYQDPAGRFPQRYHDGSRWTEHVADQGGNQSTDPSGATAPPEVPGQGPAGTAQQQAYGQQPQQDAYGQPGYGQPPSGQGYGYQGGYGQPGQASSGSRFSLSIGAIVSGVGAVLVILSLFTLDFIDVSVDLPGPGDVPELPEEDFNPDDFTPEDFDPGEFNPEDFNPEDFDPEDFTPENFDPGEFTPEDFDPENFNPEDFDIPSSGDTLGMAGPGGIRPAALATPAAPGAPSAPAEGVDLGEISGSGGDDGVTGPYANTFVRILAFLVVVAAVVTALRLPQVQGAFPQAPVVAAIVCGAFFVWHLAAAFALGVDAGGADLSPAIGAWVGAVGWLGAMAGQFLDKKLT